MDSETLRKMIEGDSLDLLKVKPKQSATLSADERLAESFYEIAAFYKEYGREPEPDISKMQEFMLAKRLANLRKDDQKIFELTDLDEFGLLKPSSAPESVDAILKEDPLNLLGDKAEGSIFTLKNVSKTIAKPDKIANRESCRDFDTFEPLFKACHAELKEGKRKLFKTIREEKIKAGQFFILSGVLMYLAEIGEDPKRTRRKDPRLLCIFENGTESRMLFRSLIKSLLTDGRCISENKDRLMDDLKDVTADDEKTGYIYILKSLSTNPEVAAIDDLYKIGFSSGAVEDRIKNAENEPTYLMAKVHLVEIFECYNVNPQKLESLLHTFFGKACLNVDVFDKSGKRCTPREWFIVPLPVIEETIALIISGEIVNYRYDQQAKLIRKR